MGRENFGECFCGDVMDSDIWLKFFVTFDSFLNKLVIL